jgi:colanic acid/amylovoran biosynthesis glycosyltransferase
MADDKSRRRTCAHYLSRYLKVQENWIYKIISHHRAYVPIVLTRKRENLSLFPITPLYNLEDVGGLRGYAEILFFRIFGYFWFFRNACVKEKVSILHVHFGNQGVKMLGLKKKLGIPMICSFYGADAFARPGKMARQYERLFKEVDRILVLGPYMRDEIIRQGCDEGKIRIHHIGIELDKIAFVRRSTGKGATIRFLIVSSFVEKKGIELAIEALSAFTDRFDFLLDIIGDGPLRGKVLQAIAASGLRDRITLHGYQPYEYFINFAYQCDVLIQASRTGSNNDKEGTPMAIVDAMATGMAVISTWHSDIPEIVTDGEDGYLAGEDDLGSLKECIGRILTEPDRIGDLGAHGRKKVEEQFDAVKQAAKLEGYYAELTLPRGLHEQQTGLF